MDIVVVEEVQDGVNILYCKLKVNDNTISGQTALTSGLATDDELLVSDGGTLKRMDVSVLTTLTDDNATALAIALG